MPSVISTAIIQGADILTSEDLARADRVARRLHGEIGAFLNSLPPEARNASGLARFLTIDRTTCQRAVFATTRHYSGPDLLLRLPGIRGLQQMVEAARAATPPIDEAMAASLDVAIEQYQELIATLGGSQSRLARRIDLTLSAGGATGLAPGPRDAADAGPRRARMKLFEAASELTGRHSQCWVAVYVYRPAPNDSGLLELFRAHGLAGHVARHDAVPLTFHNFTTKIEDGSAPTPGQFFSLANEPAMGRTPDSILREFTSDPPPVVSSKQPNEFLVQSIDENAAAAGRPVDFMLATRTSMPHPASQAPQIEEAWALVNFPCRHMLFDLYLHRDLARSCIPSLDTHLWRPDFAQHGGDRWQTRFADSPTLQLLGSGIRVTQTPEYPRLGELTRYLFGRMDAEAGEYVGFRCEVEYPMWRAGYCVSFDFTKAEGA
jgi:hypothetical protein